MVALGKRLALCSALAFLAGYTDTICFKRNQAMAVMMTGNLLVGGRALADMKESLAMLVELSYYMALIVSYMFGTFMYRMTEVKRKGRGATWLAPLVTVLFVLCETLDYLMEGSPKTRWLMCLLAPCFGAANVMSITGFISANATTATGHLISLGNVFGKMATTGISEDDRGKLYIGAVVLSSFVVGIVVADLVSDPFERRHWLFLPVGPLLSLIFLVHDSVAFSETPLIPSVHPQNGSNPSAGQLSTSMVAVQQLLDAP